ncbi:Cytochrome c oxidase assembly protein cox11, mitochondrial, partial [Spiromyces aspiralis]
MFAANLASARRATNSLALRIRNRRCCTGPLPPRAYTSDAKSSPSSIHDISARLSSRERMQIYMAQTRRKNLNGILYSGAFLITFLGIAYAAVPLYRIFCKRTGFMGVPNTDVNIRDESTLRPLEDHRRLRIQFASQVSGALDWQFVPEQSAVSVVPGETALAFYRARNRSDKPVIGVATYNVVPEKAAQYFNKIQCFCFDEQKLDPGEEIDMPVFFFIDPSFAEDPWMDD